MLVLYWALALGGSTNIGLGQLLYNCISNLMMMMAKMTRNPMITFSDVVTFLILGQMKRAKRRRGGKERRKKAVNDDDDLLTIRMNLADFPDVFTYL